MSEGLETTSLPESNGGAAPPLREGSMRLRLGFLCIAAIFLMTPYAIERGLDRPSVSQRHFFELAALLGAVAYSAGRIIGLIHCSPRDVLRPWIILYALALAVAGYFSPHPPQVFLNLLFPLAGIAFYILVFAFPWNREFLTRLISYLAVAVYAASSLGVIQGLGIKILPYVEKQITGHMSVLSIFGHPNYATSFLGPALILLLGLSAWRSTTLRRPSNALVFATMAIAGVGIGACALAWQTPGTLWLIAAAVAGGAAWRFGRFVPFTIVAVIFCLLEAGSRGVWLALAISGCTAILLLVSAQKERRVWVWKLVARVAIGLAVIAVIVAVTPLRSYASKRLHETSAIASRVYAYAIAVEMLGERPWSGWGYGSFGTEYFEAVQRFQQRPGSEIYHAMLAEMNGTPPGEVHNDLLAVSLDAGLPGVFFLFGLLLSFLLLIAMRASAFGAAGHDAQSRMLVAAFAAIVCILIDGQFSFPLRLPCSGMMFWGILAIGSRLAQSE